MYLLILALLIAVIGGSLSLVRQYQMLQQNSYFASRYFSYLKGDFKPFISALKLVLIALAVWAAFLGNEVLADSTLLFSATALYFGWRAFSLNSKSIKRLVYTARIKRMFVFSTAFLLGISIAGFLTAGILQSVLFIVLTVVILFPELLTFITLFALKPVELTVARYYINDAKKILKSVNGLKVIGITGSYGKTSTKYILSRILREKYNVLHTPESFNTPMGVVRTVREKMRADTEIFVCEMGAKNIGDIKEICDIANPDHALITSVGPQHLETFKTIDNVYKTKFELADAVSKKQGIILANGDNKIIFDRKDGNTVLYGSDNSFKFYAENISGGRNGASFVLVLENEKISVTTKLLGRHNVLNIVGASALAYKLGVPANDIRFAISKLQPTEHRLEMKSSLNGSLLIDDAYNSNPEGCLEAVNVLSSFEGMQKVIITPGLVELGDKEYESNKALGKASALVCDKIIFVGEKRSEPLADGVSETDFNKDNMFIASSFMEAMEIYKQFADSNTVVLLENDLPDNYLK